MKSMALLLASICPVFLYMFSPSPWWPWFTCEIPLLAVSHPNIPGWKELYVYTPLNWQYYFNCQSDKNYNIVWLKTKWCGRTTLEQTTPVEFRNYSLDLTSVGQMKSLLPSPYSIFPLFDLNNQLYKDQIQYLQNR